jgi:uncharacterized protein (TIGR02118 family)
MVKLMVMYPRPQDIEVFEKRYVEEHIPLAISGLAGRTKLVTTRILASADGMPAPFYRIAEVYFPSMNALQDSAQSEKGKETIGHAVNISTGGTPLFLIAEVETVVG